MVENGANFTSKMMEVWICPWPYRIQVSSSNEMNCLATLEQLPHRVRSAVTQAKEALQAVSQATNDKGVKAAVAQDLVALDRLVEKVARILQAAQSKPAYREALMVTEVAVPAPAKAEAGVARAVAIRALEEALAQLGAPSTDSQLARLPVEEGDAPTREGTTTEAFP